MIVSVWVDKNLEVVVLEDHRVMLDDTALDVLFGKLGCNVQVLGVPQHFCSSALARLGFAIGFDIDEILGPRRGLPRSIIEFAVDHQRHR